jgi:Acetyltransferase (GNAT) domain
MAELCLADHRNDPGILQSWLANKTPEFFMSWLNQPDNSLLVAVKDGRILAVGSVTNAAKITLNYVSPDVRFRGVSRGMLGALEARAAERATHDACSPAPRQPAGAIRPAATWKMERRLANSGRSPATR